MSAIDETPDGRTVYLWEVEPCHDDGAGTSGWTLTVVSMTPDLSDLSRIVRVALDTRFREGYGEGYAATWTGIKRAVLIGHATLDPRLDGHPELRGQAFEGDILP